MYLQVRLLFHSCSERRNCLSDLASLSFASLTGGSGARFPGFPKRQVWSQLGQQCQAVVVVFVCCRNAVINVRGSVVCASVGPAKLHGYAIVIRTELRIVKKSYYRLI